MDERFELPKIGDILLEEFLEPLEITPYRLAKDLGISTSSILDLIHNNLLMATIPIPIYLFRASQTSRQIGL